MASDVLFKPFEFKGLRLPNRIVMAPMTRSFSPGGVATEEVAAYYRRRAENQVGLIVTEGTGVDRPASLNDPNVPRFHGDKELAAADMAALEPDFRALLEAVKQLAPHFNFDRDGRPGAVAANVLRDSVPTLIG